MPDGTYHCVICENIKKLVLSDNPYTCQKRMTGKKEIVFSIKGNYTKAIKSCGIKKFIELINNYDPLADEMRKILY